MKYLALYERKNGEIIYRYRKSKPKYNIGSYTSMGWKLVDIRLLENGQAYSYSAYDSILDKRRRLHDLFCNFDIKNIIELLMIMYVIKTFFVK